MIKYLLLFSIPFLLSADKEPVRQGQDFALFIAIDHYDSWPDLRNPVSDAAAIAQELERNYDFSTQTLVNPTRTEIYGALEQFRLRSYGDQDQLFIFFSGHGDFNEGTAEGFFVPKEGQLNDPFQDTYIPHTRLERIVGNIPCNHILLAIDACFSGTFDESIALQRGRPGVPPAGAAVDERQWFINRQLTHVSRLYLTSGGKERTPDGDRYSPFTARFLEALRSYGIDDGILTFAELTGFMQRVEPLPRFGEFGGHEPGGDFLFVSNSVPTQPVAVSPANIPGNTTPNTPAIENPPASQQPSVSLGGANPSAQMDVRTPVRGQVKAESGITYPTVSIFGKTWTTYNLIENIGSKESDCYNQASYCDTYGRLYSWEGAKQACRGLGEGWRLPSQDDWRSLIDPFGGTEQSGDDYGTAAYDALGPKTFFNAFLGGYKQYSNDYHDIGQYGVYWSSTMGRADPVAFVFSVNRAIYERPRSNTSQKLSCRCVKDN